MYSADELYDDEITSPLERPQAQRKPRVIRRDDLSKYGRWNQHEEKREIYFATGETYVWDYQRAVYVRAD